MPRLNIVFLPFSILTAILALTHGDVLYRWAVVLWHDPNFSHGLLMPLVAGFAAWRNLQPSPPVLAWSYTARLCAFALLLLGLFLYLAGRLGGELFSLRLSFIVELFAIVLLLAGPGMAKRLLFPFSLLLLAIPVPYILYNAAAFPLKQAATRISAWMLDASGMAVFRDGNILTLPHNTLEVVDACSGIRSLATLFTLGYCLAGFFHRNWLHRFILLGLVVPAAVFSNSLRLFLTGWLTLLDPGWATGFRHELTGWLVFLLSSGLLFAASFFLTKSEKKKRLIFYQHSMQPLPAHKEACWNLTLMAAFFLIATHLAYLSLHKQQGRPLHDSLSLLPQKIGVFSLSGSQTLSPEIQAVLRADDHLLRRYRHPDGSEFWLFIGYFARQEDGAFIHSPRHCLPGSGWETGPGRRLVLKTGAGGKTSVTVNQFIIQKGLERQLVHYWYQGRGRIVASEFADRALTVWDAVTRKRTEGALIRVTGPVKGAGADASSRQQEFILALLPVLDGFFIKNVQQVEP